MMPRPDFGTVQKAGLKVQRLSPNNETPPPNAGNFPLMSRGIIPVDPKSTIQHKSNMTNSVEILIERIEKKLDERGTSAHAASKAVVGHKDMIRDMKRRGSMPSLPKLRKLAEYLDTSVDWLTGVCEVDEPTGAIHDTAIPLRGSEAPRDVPILGSALGHDMQLMDNDDSLPVEMHLVEMGEPVDYLRRLPTIKDRHDVYGIVVVGESMIPRFRPGEPVYVDPKRAPQIGDDVIIQLVQPDGDGGQEVISALIKTLVRRSSGFIELEQYNPTQIFRLETNKIFQVHRIIPWAELIGI